MATAYTHFDPTKPAPTSQSVSACFDSDRNNLFALAMALLMGFVPGWNMTITPGTGTYLEPQYATYSKGTYRMKFTFTRNGSGQVTTTLAEWSNDSGATYDTASTLTINYDAATGAVTDWTGTEH